MKLNRFITQLVWISVLILGGAMDLFAVSSEIRIYDNHGALRVVKPIHSTVEVAITVDGVSLGDPIILSNTVGLAPDVTGKQLSPENITFHAVGSGSWKVISPAPKLSVKSVEIVEGHD